MATKNRKYLYLRKYDRHLRNSNGKSGVFDHDELDKSLANCATTEAGNGRLAPRSVYIAIYCCRSLSQSLGNTFTELAMVKNAGYVVGISTLFCHTFGYVSTSGFGSHIAISDVCQCHIYLWILSLSFPWSKTSLLPAL